MEFIETLTLMMALFCGVSILILISNKIGLIGKTNQKTSKQSEVRQSDKELNQYWTEKVRSMQEIHQEEIKIYKKKIQSLTNTINSRSRFTKYESEEEEDDNDNDLNFAEKYEIDFNKAKEYAGKIGIDSNGITDPEILPIVVEKIKENEELALMLGIIRRKGTMGNMAQNQQNSNQSPIDATAQALIDAGQYA